jgi:hypothetical protein
MCIEHRQRPNCAGFLVYTPPALISKCMTLNALVQDIRQATDYQRNKLKLKEQIQTDLLLPHENGLFKVTPDLMCFLNTWDEDLVFVEDIYGNPVLCKRLELLAQCKQQYAMVMNRWHQQHEQLQRQRKI